MQMSDTVLTPAEIQIKTLFENIRLGIVPVKKGAENEMSEEETLEDRYRRHSGLYGSLLTYRFDGFISDTPERKLMYDQIRQTAAEICEGKPRIVCFFGRPGIGKSHLACSMMHEIMLTKKKNGLNRTVQYFNSDRICNEYYESRKWSSRTDDEEIIAHCSSYDFSVFDEIGMNENNRAAEKYLFFRIIDNLYLYGLSAALCSNYSTEEFTENMKDATVDRLLSRAVIIKTDGIESWRTKQWTE